MVDMNANQETSQFFGWLAWEEDTNSKEHRLPRASEIGHIYLHRPNVEQVPTVHPPSTCQKLWVRFKAMSTVVQTPSRWYTAFHQWDFARFPREVQRAGLTFTSSP